jgi:hypothetical protein
MPKELMLILSALSEGKGVGRSGTASFFSLKGTRIDSQAQVSSQAATGIRGEASPLEINLLLGFGVLNLMFGGMVLFSSARTHLIRLVIPEDPSPWPTFGFTDPM